MQLFLLQLQHLDRIRHIDASGFYSVNNAILFEVGKYYSRTIDLEMNFLLLRIDGGSNCSAYAGSVAVSSMGR